MEIEIEGKIRQKKVCETPLTANEHIGSMAALPPLERAVRKERLPPAGKCLEAATAPICHHVVRKRGNWQRKKSENNSQK